MTHHTARYCKRTGKSWKTCTDVLQKLVFRYRSRTGLTNAITELDEWIGEDSLSSLLRRQHPHHGPNTSLCCNGLGTCSWPGTTALLVGVGDVVISMGRKRLATVEADYFLRIPSQNDGMSVCVPGPKKRDYGIMCTFTCSHTHTHTHTL
jgi:hypothetical protein